MFTFFPKYSVSVIAALLLVTSGGCQWLTRQDREKLVDISRDDHRDCHSRGYRWASDAYMECRLDLYNQRLQKQWFELNAMRQRQQVNPGELQTGPSEPFRPVLFRNFFCDRRIADDGYDYIYCGEKLDDH